MRLLNVDTLHFEVFYRQFIPPFAILSHTWSHVRGDKEVSFKKFVEIRLRNPIECESEYEIGYNKIINFCDFIKKRQIFNFDELRKSRPDAFAESDRKVGTDRLETLHWVWIDTCCIDDSSSMEVFEAINSMWWWYWFAEECFVYLIDLDPDPIPANTFDDCRWFTRGWTLQELLAPRTKIFCNSKWDTIGYVGSQPDCLSKRSSWDLEDLTNQVSKRTKIPQHCLENRKSIENTSIAQRLSWAVGRETLKIEDRFYCLLGILGVNMYPLYGEGRLGFFRLQEEIIKSSRDQSIFCWRYIEDANPGGHAEVARMPIGMLAPHIDCFKYSGDQEELRSSLVHHVSSKNVGLKMRVRIQKICAGDGHACVLHSIQLGKPSKDSSGHQNNVAVLECKHHEDIEFYRSRCNDRLAFGQLRNFFLTISNYKGKQNEPKERKIYIEKIRFLHTQCNECRKFDEDLASRADEFSQEESGPSRQSA